MWLKEYQKFRRYCTVVNRSFYITTPIFYVNASPHIGHLYSAVIADAIFRFENLFKPNKQNKFSTGTDEHGTKIQQAAAKQKLPIDEYCKKISYQYETLFMKSNVKFTDFIRTTDTKHKQAVEHFWKTLSAKNLIYLSNYEGWYCVSDETFVTESQLKKNSEGNFVSAESGHPVEWTSEQNYIFKLSNFQDDIIAWSKCNERIKPKKFQKILLDMLKEPLPDIAVSRPTSRVHWGIRVPGDETQTIYVWLDALVNYLTCTGYPNESFYEIWPPSLQVLGKDILKFHGIYWPGFLIGAGLDLPSQLLVHSHWTVDGEKMSKSKNNVVDPFERSELYTAEGLRYFLLREGVAHSDGNYSDIKIMRILNAELADTLGNLLSRCCAKSLNKKQMIPAFNKEEYRKMLESDSTKKLVNLLSALPDKCRTHYENHNFHFVVDSVIETLHAANNFFETSKPWELKNGNELQMLQLDSIICLTIETLRVCGIILQPIIPKLSKHLLDKLNISETDRTWNNLNMIYDLSQTDGSDLGNVSSLLFKRIV